MSWVVVPAAGSGTRFGAALPKQYQPLAGRPLIEHTLLRLAVQPQVRGLMVVLAADDPHWSGTATLEGKPLCTAVGGATRADSVLAGLRALPDAVGDDDWVLVHDAARPCLKDADFQRLYERGSAHAVGALLAAPVRDTLKRAGARGAVESTEPRAGLWRAFTPQMFRRGALVRALEAARAAGVGITDEAMAIERMGLRPLLVEGGEDNIKVTSPADLALAELLLRRDGG